MLRAAQSIETIIPRRPINQLSAVSSWSCLHNRRVVYHHHTTNTDKHKHTTPYSTCSFKVMVFSSLKCSEFQCKQLSWTWRWLRWWWRDRLFVVLQTKTRDAPPHQPPRSRNRNHIERSCAERKFREAVGGSHTHTHTHYTPTHTIRCLLIVIIRRHHNSYYMHLLLFDTITWEQRSSYTLHFMRYNKSTNYRK